MGNAVPDVSVTFMTPGSGAGATLKSATAMTGMDGQASLLVSANGVAGSYEIMATVAGVATPKLLSYGEEGKLGEEEPGYAYEALNFADGKHSARQITDQLSAEYGAVPLDVVVEYLQALKSVGLVD